MPVSTASAPELVTPDRSHYIGVDWLNGHGASGFGPHKEELWPIAEADWRGKRYRVELSADRYLASNGWTSWRVYVRKAYALEADGAEPDYLSRHEATDKARAALGEVCEPLVLEWLEGVGYLKSRRRAFAGAVRRTLRDSAGSPTDNRAALLLSGYADELNPIEAGHLFEALKHLELFHDAIEREALS